MSTADVAVRRMERRVGERRSSVKIPRRELLSLCTGLAALQRAGVPLLQALEGMRDSAKSVLLERLLEDVLDAIERGDALSVALARHPRTFDRFFTSMVAVGEATGRLDEILERLAEHIEREEDLNSQLRGAAAYPLFSLFITMSIIGFIMVVVVPRFMKTFSSSGVPLPVPTQIVVDISAFLQENALLLAALAVVVPFPLAALGRVPSIRAALDGLKLRLPLTGPLYHRVLLVRFSRGMQLLTESGIALLDGLGLIKGVTGNTVFAAEIEELIEHLSSGGRIGEFVRESPLFPPMAYQLISAGESSGKLGDLLGEISRFYDKETQRRLKIIVSLMEPAMICLLGLLVGGIVISLFLPMFTMVQGMAK